jgi:hypothetical protein
MRRLASLLLLAALTAACSKDEPIYKPALRVDRLSLAEGCYRACAGSDPALDYAEQMCADGQSVACGFAAGADRMRIVARFDSVQVSPELQPPTPKLTMIADEVLEDKSVVVDRTTGTVPVYTAVLRAPPRRVDALSFRFEVVDGYEAEVSDLSVSAPLPQMEVFGCMPDQACSRTAGVGAAVVSITVPDGIEPVKLLRWLDDEPQDPPRDAARTVSENGLSTWQVSTPIPDHGASFRLLATAGGYPSKDRTIALLPPTITLDLAGCEASGCTRPAGVGKQVISVLTPSGLGEPTLLFTLDGAVQPSAQKPALLSDDGVSASWQSSVQTPYQEGALWCIDALVGKLHAGASCITLTKPDIQIEIAGCSAAATCVLPAQSQVVLTVTAPKGISPTSALVRATLDGIPLLGQDLPVSLGEVNGQLVTGYVATLVPASPGKVWQLKAYLNESQSAPSLPIHIAAATP